MINKKFLLGSILLSIGLVGCSEEANIRAGYQNTQLQNEFNTRVLNGCGERRESWQSTGDVVRNSQGKTAQQWLNCKRAIDNKFEYSNRQINNRFDAQVEVLREDFLRKVPVGVNPAVTCLDENGNILHDRMGYQSSIGRVDENGNIQLNPGYDNALKAGTRQSCN